MHSFKWLQIFLCKINNFICTQLNVFKYRYVTLTIQFKHTIREFQVLLINTNNSIQHYMEIVSIQLNCYKYCYVSLTIQLNISHLFTQLNGLTVQFLTIQFNINHLFAHSLKGQTSSIWPIDMTLSGATTLGQSRPGSNGNEGILHIPQSSRAGTSPSDCLMSYPGHLGVEVLLLCKDAVGVFYSFTRGFTHP